MDRSSGESESGPWEGQQPFLRDVFQQAQNLYQWQGPHEFFPGQTYADYNPTQMGAINWTKNRAQNGAPHEDAAEAWVTRNLKQWAPDTRGAQGAANMGTKGVSKGYWGLLDTRDSAMNRWESQNMAGMGTDPWANRALGSTKRMNFWDAARKTSAPSDVSASLRDISRGGPNPYLDDMYDSAARKMKESFQDTVLPGVNATFGGAGRTGGGIHAEAVGDASGDFTDSLGSLAADIYGGAYNTDADRRLTAGTSLLSDDATRKGISADMYLGDRGLSQDMITSGWGNQLDQNRLGFDYFNSGQDRSYNASRDLMSLGLDSANTMGDLYSQIMSGQATAAGMAPSITDMQYGNIDRYRAAGDDLQAMKQLGIDERMQRFNFNQMAPWDMLRMYSDIIGGTNSINVSSSDDSSWGIDF